MAILYLAIDSTPIKIPKTEGFTIGYYKISDLKRTVNGDQSGDFIALKRTFNFTYESIYSSELNVIINILMGQQKMFYTLTINIDGNTSNYTVYPGAIPASLYRTGEDWVWTGVSFQVIEK